MIENRLLDSNQLLSPIDEPPLDVSCWTLSGAKNVRCGVLGIIRSVCPLVNVVYFDGSLNVFPNWRIIFRREKPNCPKESPSLNIPNTQSSISID